MPPPKPNPRKRKLDVMDLDEMAQDPSLKGMLSFLQTSPDVARERHEARVRMEKAESKEPGSPLPESTDSSPELAQVHIDPPAVSTRVEPSLPSPLTAQLPPASTLSGTATSLATGDAPARAELTPVFSTRVETTPFVYRRPRIREAPSCQDGHSLGEHALYDALFRAAAPYSQHARIITIGFTRMSELARLAYRNCKINTRALVAKLALEPVSESSFTQGRTYLVYAPETVLQRRRQAGLTHVIKTKGVVFVDPQTGESLLSTPAESTRLESDPAERGGSVPATLTQGFRHMMSMLGGTAIRQLWNQCQAAAPDCTPEEVLYYSELKLRQAAAAGKSIGNPDSFLLATVPGCFTGPAGIYLGRRRAIEAQKLQEESELSSQRAEWQRLASDPATPEKDRTYYEKLLGNKERSTKENQLL